MSNEKAMLAMVALGCGEMVGGQFLGRCIDKIGSRKSTLINAMIMTIMAVFSISFLIVNKYDWLAFAMALFWGIQDSSINI